ncbi:MAG: hypothetical protein PVI23_09900 [Maricaulaceae bacterium]|jgi:hypothetical protein
MSKSILRAGVAGVAIALVAGFAASAQTVNSGYVGANIGYAELEAGGSSEDGTTYGIDGAWATPLGDGNLGLQLDASWDTLDFDNADIDTLAGAAHVFTRQSDSHAIGGFVDFRNIDLDSSGDLDATSVGAEGAILNGGFAFEGELAWVNLDGGGGADADGFGGSVGMTFYPNETVGYGGYIGTLQLDDSGSDIDVTTLGADFEMQIPNTNFTGYAGVEWADTDLGGPSYENTQIMIGIRFNGGIASPAERQAYGASFNGADRYLNLF